MQDGPAGRQAGELEAEDLVFLLSHGLSAGTLLAAARAAREQGVTMDAALIAGGFMEEDAFYRALARECGLPFLNAPRVAMKDKPAVVLAAGLAPLPDGQEARWVIAPRGARIRPLLDMSAAGRRMDGFALTTPQRFEQAVLSGGGGRIAGDAANGLADRAPGRSFRGQARRGELLMMLALVFAASFWVTHAGAAGAFDAAGAICCVVSVGLVIRLAATVEGAPPIRSACRALRDRDLPSYTVLVALYDEAVVVPDLCAALARLDYPPSKLEVLFLVEARDRSTRAALEAHLRPQTQRIVTCPPGEPRTKPRALNIGLALARGDLVVIYDAEDEPAPDQLRLAAARLAAANPRLACLQAVLAVHNDDRSRLARLFRLEYAALFRVVLPGLARMGLPIPLGGTSNHFRRAALVAAGGWDAWNVTEDADLGLRLASLGYDIDVLESETAEAAPEDLGQWFPQRTRWFKGWIQTSIVASRLHGASWRSEPVRQIATFGHGWSTVVTALVAPATILCLAAVAPFAADTPRAQILTALGVVVFVAGAYALAWPIVVGAARARIQLSAVDLLLVPPYLVLVCAAAWAAVWELLVAPFQWNKTRHGRAPDSAAGATAEDASPVHLAASERPPSLPPRATVTTALPTRIPSTPDIESDRRRTRAAAAE